MSSSATPVALMIDEEVKRLTKELERAASLIKILDQRGEVKKLKEENEKLKEENEIFEKANEGYEDILAGEKGLIDQNEELAEENKQLTEENKQLTKECDASEHHRAIWQREANISREGAERYVEIAEAGQRDCDFEHQRYLETQEKYSEKLWEVCQELDIENNDKSENIIKEIKKFKEENKELRLWVERNQEEIDRLREVIDGSDDDDS